MKYLATFVLFSAITVSVISQPVTPPSAASTADHSSDHPAESRDNLLEILHHIYLWYYDESFFPPGSETEDATVYFRMLQHSLDQGDNSQFAELYLPRIQLLVELKRSDYHISEVDLRVRDELFKIRRVDRVAESPAPLEEYRTTTFSNDELRDWFNNKVHQATPYPEAIANQLRDTLLRHQFREQWDDQAIHIFFASPLSNVSNDFWVLHENTNQLLQFSADMDIKNPDTWAHMTMRLRFHTLDADAILRPDYQADGEVELSKDFIGRVLFNCVVLGNRVEVLPEDVKAFLGR